MTLVMKGGFLLCWVFFYIFTCIIEPVVSETSMKKILLDLLLEENEIVSLSESEFKVILIHIILKFSKIDEGFFENSKVWSKIRMRHENVRINNCDQSLLSIEI